MNSKIKINLNITNMQIYNNSKMVNRDGKVLILNLDQIIIELF